MKAIIISNGDFNIETLNREFCKEDLKKVYKVAVDGGAKYFYKHSVIPDIIVGDLDSVNLKIVEYYRKKGVEILKYPSKKDVTDTEIALQHLNKKKIIEVIMFGMTGKRLDHLLGNIGVLYGANRLKTNAKILDEYNEVRIVRGKLTIEKNDNYKYISLIPYGGDAEGVTLRGFKYNLTDRDIKQEDTLGISNEILEETATIAIRKGYMVFIRSKD